MNSQSGSGLRTIHVTRRALLQLLVIFLATLSLVSGVAAESPQVGILQHFVSLPAGLSAEGLVIRAGYFYVSTINFTARDGTIFVFDHEGKLSRKLAVPGFPVVGQLAFKDDRTLYAVAGNLRTETGAVLEVHLDTGTVSLLATGFQVPNGLAVDARSNLYVTDIIAGTVSRIAPEGRTSLLASGPLLETAPIPQLGLSLGPNDLAFGKDGALYVTNLGLGTVVRISFRDDGIVASVTNFAAIQLPDGIAFDVKGEMYVTSPLTNIVHLVLPDGSVHLLDLDTTSESLSNPSNVAFVGPKLYVTNFGLDGKPGVSFVKVRFPGLSLLGSEE